MWWPVAPASRHLVEALRASAPISLPDFYLEQLLISNGGEGDLGVEPGWIVFWPAEEVIERNAGYDVPSNVPGFFGFGSNGGGELLAFDARGAQPFPIVMIPFIPMEEGEAVRIADSFSELQTKIGVSSEGAG